MEQLTATERRQIVKEELEQLEQEKYISAAISIEVMEAHHLYYDDLKAKKQVERKAVNAAPVIEHVQPEPVKVKKQLSKQEVRERNITWSLNLGVVLLLIGGLVLATSTWDTLSNLTKTGLIALVALMFFGLAFFTSSVLKIKKTAFAFYVLGSLFLPIVILSAGYFELFGSYFSFAGEGRYLLGATGCFVIFPVYLLLAVRLESRLFIWFSYMTISIFASFIIAAMYLSVDGFYLGMMVFNAVLILAYVYLKRQNRLKQFTKEFILYIQANLILTTLLMLVFYNHELIYGFNLLLTAVLYFAMIFVANQKEYQFVFSAMLVYGVYQLVTFSALVEVGAIVYALLGFVFILIPLRIPENHSLKKTFQYTSAAISGLAFIYITLEGIILRINEPSLIMLLAYIIISLNFTFLTTVVKKRIFNYLSPVFFTAALYEVVLLGQELFGYKSLGLPMFIAGLLFYVLFGCLIKLSFFQMVKESTRDVAATVMLICILIGFVSLHWWQVGTMLLLVSALAIFIDRFEKRTLFTVSAMVHAISLGLAVAMYYAAWIEQDFLYYYVNPMEATNLILAGIVVLAASMIWRHFKWENFSKDAFFTSQVFYGLGILLAFSSEIDAVWRALILIGGVGMAYLLYRKTNEKMLAYVIGVLTLAFYLSVLYAIDVKITFDSNLYDLLEFVVGAFLLLVAGFIIGKRRDQALTSGFWWIGHLYLPFALAFTFLIHLSDSAWVFAIATVLYGLSVGRSTQEWKVKTFLYASFTSFLVTVSLGMTLLDLDQYLHYAFLITSCVIAVLWYLIKEQGRKRVAYYLVPFSMVGIVSFITVYPYALEPFLVTVIYSVGLLFMMHKQKWDVLSVIPLILVYYALRIYSVPLDEWELLLLALYGITLTTVGYFIYPLFYQEIKEKGRMENIDWYSVIGLVALGSLYLLKEEALWAKLLPGILITLYLIVQRKRIPRVPSKWGVFVACAYLLQPYYALLGHIQIPELFERELYVLPWIIPAVFLKKMIDPRHKVIASRVQWAVLLVVALLLVQDGLASNTIYDAIIIGVLSLVSILGGMAFQIKSFFFVGSGVLLLNVFLQTRPYWGSMPWWVYLLIAGSILITVASYNEWHKQKASDGKDTLLSIFNKKVVQKLKKWD